MITEIRWIASSSASAFYASLALLRGVEPADNALAKVLADPAKQLGQFARQAGSTIECVERHLLGLSICNEDNTQLAAILLRKMIGPKSSEPAVNELAGVLRDINRAFREVQPDVISELELRAPVLREQWDARGPGLLRSIGQMTDPNLIVSNADVVLVYPFLGGGGHTNLLYNSVVIEAVLANPNPILPEIVRLGWLLSQVQMDVPIYNEAISAGHIDQVATLAMLPAALAAAEHVELAHLTRDTLQAAMASWLSYELPREYAQGLWDWWTTLRQSKVNWQVALAALDQMLSAG